MARRVFDYIFVDESGDPGKFYTSDPAGNKIPTGSSRYYILTAVCLDSQKLFQLENRILEIRNQFNYKGELKSNEISLPLHRALLKLVNDLEIKIYYRIIDKTTYKGVFAVSDDKKLHNVFDEYNLTKLVSFAIKKENYNEVEVVIDRTDRRLLDGKFDNFDEYLKRKVNTKTIRRINHITHVNSEYVNAMQISDLVSGALKDHITKKNRDLKNAINKKYLMKIW